MPGISNVSNYLKNDHFTIVKKLLDIRQKQELSVPRVDAVFNEIADADSSSLTLQKLENLRKSAFPNTPFFNKPVNIMKTTRDNIYTLLQGIEKLHVPKTLRFRPGSSKEIHAIIKKEGFGYPVIFRQAGDHGGKSTIKVDDQDEQFSFFALDGREYYLTQFVDFKDENGFYQKIRLVVVNKDVYIRGVLTSENWMVHHRSRLANGKSEKLEEQILDKFEIKIKPKIEKQVSAISERLGLDFFGMDCNIDKDMNILLFEANASMTVLSGSETKKLQAPFIEKIRIALINMISNR